MDINDKFSDQPTPRKKKSEKEEVFSLECSVSREAKGTYTFEGHIEHDEDFSTKLLAKILTIIVTKTVPKKDYLDTLNTLANNLGYEAKPNTLKALISSEDEEISEEKDETEEFLKLLKKLLED